MLICESSFQLSEIDLQVPGSHPGHTTVPWSSGPQLRTVPRDHHPCPSSSSEGFTICEIHFLVPRCGPDFAWDSKAHFVSFPIPFLSLPKTQVPLGDS